MQWLKIILLIPVITVFSCGPANLDSSPVVNAKGGKEEIIPVPQKKAVRCTKSLPPICFDEDGNRVTPESE